MPHSILIVEDDLTFATMLKTWLGKKGFSVDTASSNARARKQLDAQPYDLVLSDLRLPDQDGIFLLSWMKEQKYNIPLIIMTGYADIQSAVQAIWGVGFPVAGTSFPVTWKMVVNNSFMVKGLCRQPAKPCEQK